MKIVWLESDSLSVELPRPNAPHEWVQYPYSSSEQVPARIASADWLVVNKVKIGEAQLDAAPKLKGIAITATGKDNVDVAACQGRGIQVRNVVNYGPESVAEHAFACVLQLVRRVPEWQALVQDGAWSRSRFFCLHDLPMRSLRGMTLAVLGSGAIGQALTQFARAFGMEVIRVERAEAESVRAGYVAFEAALAQADVLSLHCPLTAQTQGLVGPEMLASMKRGAILINTARGGLVQFDALRQALESGQLSGAALDVLDVEPPPSDHPMLVWRHPRLIVTPHVAWGTEQAQNRVAEMTCENLEDFLKSKV